MKLRCPFNASTIRCGYTIEVRNFKEDNPPFFYSPQTGIDKMIEHIQKIHPFADIMTFFEDYMAKVILESSEFKEEKTK